MGKSANKKDGLATAKEIFKGAFSNGNAFSNAMKVVIAILGVLIFISLARIHRTWTAIIQLPETTEQVTENTREIVNMAERMLCVESELVKHAEWARWVNRWIDHSGL